MASVRMTHELRMQIRHNSESAYDTANPKPQPSNEYIDKVRSAIVNSPEQKFLKDMAEIGEQRGLKAHHGRNVLPRHNRDDITAVSLRSFKNTEEQRINDYSEQTITFNTPMSKYWVTEETNVRWGNPTVYVQDLAKDDAREVLEMYNKHEQDLEDWHEAKRNYDGQIYGLLDKCTTLKQLLDIWPAAESLVPSEKLQKMHVKVTRKERAEQVKEEINFDPSVANQTVLTARLLGG
jgi:hypothetical protein